MLINNSWIIKASEIILGICTVLACYLVNKSREDNKVLLRLAVIIARPLDPTFVQ